MNNKVASLSDNKEFLFLLLASASAALAGIGVLGVLAGFGSVIHGDGVASVVFGLLSVAVVVGGVLACRYAFARKFASLTPVVSEKV